MSHTPQQIADLARAALPAIMPQRADLKTEAQYVKADHALYKFREACTPATILALCERLRLASAAIPDYSPDFPASAEYMNRPLTESNKNDAARLAAVLRVLYRRTLYLADENSGLVEWEGDGTMPPFNPKAKDDLARVVAMLTPGQRARFELALNHQIRDDGRPHDPVSAYEAITAPASVWLAALAVATGVE